MAAAAQSTTKLRCLVIGRGAMGLLHGNFLEQAGHSVAFARRPGAAARTTKAPASGVISLAQSNIRRLQGPSIGGTKDAERFFQPAESNIRNCLLVAVKAYDVEQALSPFAELCGPAKHDVASPVVDSVILLHNGLLDENTGSFLDRHVPQAASMISTNGSTLLPPGELPDGYEKAAKHMGLGSSLLFPRHELPIQDEASSRFFDALATFASAMPGESKILSTDDGRCEQFVKLAINVSINGLLARRALDKWQTTKRQEDVISVTNKLVLEEMELARSIARLVMWKAQAAHPDNAQLRLVNEQDIAAQRVEAVCLATQGNICSTVSDLIHGRRTERSALLTTVLEEWPTLENAHNIDEPANVLQTINQVLKQWDEWQAQP